MITGIDPGLRCTAAVTLDETSKAVLYTAFFGSSYNDTLHFMIRAHPADRYKEYCNRLESYLVLNKIVGTIVLEQPYGQISGFGTRLLELNGAYLVLLGRLFPSCKILLPSPTEIKKLFTGKGTSDKQDIINYCKINGFFPANHHVADAFAMAYGFSK